MRYAVMELAMACVATPLLAQEKAEEGPSNERAQTAQTDAGFRSQEFHEGR